MHHGVRDAVMVDVPAKVPEQGERAEALRTMAGLIEPSRQASTSTTA